MAPLRCIDMTSVTSPQQTGRSGADIPGPRGGQGVRLLVLGTDSDAQELRDQALAAGYELAQRYSARVSHVAYGSGIDPGDARYARIRDAGLPIVPIQACAYELGLGAGESAATPRELKQEHWQGELREAESAGENVLVPTVPMVPMVPAQERDSERAVVPATEGERTGEADPVELDSAPGDDVDVAGHDVEVAGGDGAVEVEVEVEVEVAVRSDVAADEGLGMLEFSALDPLTESAAGLVPGFDVDFCSDVAEADAESDVVSDVVAAGNTADTVDADAAVSETPYELPLGGAVIGVDPWVGDADITGFIPVIGPETVLPAETRPESERAGEAGGAALKGAVDVVAGVAADASVADTTAMGAAATGAAPTGATDVDVTAAAATGAESQSAGRKPTRRFLLSLTWALVPFVSFGLLTPATFGYAAYRLRSRTLAFAALGYTLAVVLAFALSAARPPSATPGDAVGTLLTLALAAMWIGGTVHALSLRAKVFAA